jgi:hypothetical protein
MNESRRQGVEKKGAEARSLEGLQIRDTDVGADGNLPAASPRSVSG